MKKTPRKIALDTLQKLVRLKAADENGYCTCVTCGKIDLWKSMDGGHYIPKGNSSYWALEEENIHPQCKRCNGFEMKFGTAAQQYTLYMIDTKKISKREYEAMTKEWKQQIKEHLERLK